MPHPSVDQSTTDTFSIAGTKILPKVYNYALLLEITKDSTKEMGANCICDMLLVTKSLMISFLKCCFVVLYCKRVLETQCD